MNKYIFFNKRDLDPLNSCILNQKGIIPEEMKKI